MINMMVQALDDFNLQVPTLPHVVRHTLHTSGAARALPMMSGHSLNGHSLLELRSGLGPEQEFALTAALLVPVIATAMNAEARAIVWRGLKRGSKLLRKKASGTGIWLGADFLSDDSRLRHTQISGATGWGKTVLVENLLFSDLKRGYGALVVDPKGERDFYEKVKAYCRSIGREKDLYYLSATHSEESCIWNPCGLGSESELQTKFYNSGIYEEPHYAKACENGLLRAFKTLSEGRETGITLNDLIREIESIDSGDREQTLKGLYYDLSNIALGEWAKVLGCGEALSGGGVHQNAGQEVSILDVVTGNKILFVDLPTEGKKVQSSRIGRLLTQEIILISGMRKRIKALRSGKPFPIYIDEFDAFATESFASFINKGRSSRFMVHIIHQTLSDLRAISPTFIGQIIGNCNVAFIFRHGDPDDSEAWARFIGTKPVTLSTYRTQNGSQTGESSNRLTDEFIIPPDKLKSMPVGSCVYSNKLEGIARIIKVPMTAEVRVPVTAVEVTVSSGASEKALEIGQSKGATPSEPVTALPAAKNLSLEQASPGLTRAPKKDWDEFLPTKKAAQGNPGRGQPGIGQSDSERKS